MKIFNNLIKASFAVVLLLLVASGCKETGDLIIDPVEYDTLFTFTPSHGYPGTAVQIKGDNLSGVTKVAFGNIEGDITSQTASAISAVVPVGAETAKIKLVKDGIVVNSMVNFVVDLSPIPTIVEFSPAIAGSGDVIDITGSLLDEVDSVFIGSLKAEISGTPTASAMQIIAPVGLQTGKIRLFYTYMTNYGMLKPAESVSDAELSLALPVLASIEPAITALNIGDSVTIKGTMMSEVTKIEFGTVNATPFTYYGDTMIAVYVPVGATTGKIKLTVPDGFIESGTFQVNLPIITSFLPTKGPEQLSTSTRAISLKGSKLDLVNAVLVGATTATIQTQKENEIIFTIPGNAAGTISLQAVNGTVTSSIPFFFTGDMWVNDWATVFPVDRYDRIANNGLGGFVLDETAGYARITADGAINGKSVYIWGPGAGNDKFILYTPDPNGVYIEFDLRVAAIGADSCMQADGTLKFKLFMMDARGWGASGEYSYGYNGPTSYVLADGEWHHFRMHLKDFKASNNSGLYTADQVTATAGAFCHPNSLRIVAPVFGIPKKSGIGTMTLDIDNLKYVIEE